MRSNLFNVSEIFSSIQGEGRFTGFPTTFIRFYGCNMLCTYCDTMYAVRGGKFNRMGISKIMTYVKSIGNRHICLTGGEPLMQDNILQLIDELASSNYEVSIETNGGIKLPDTSSMRKFTYTMDVKTPSSGMSEKNLYENIEHLSPRDEIKFVIGDLEDYEFAKSVIRKYPSFASIIFSPKFRGKKSEIAGELSEWLIKDRIPNARIGIQTHKFLGVD